jgi:hypothetical protein
VFVKDLDIVDPSPFVTIAGPENDDLNRAFLAYGALAFFPRTVCQGSSVLDSEGI